MAEIVGNRMGVKELFGISDLFLIFSIFTNGVKGLTPMNFPGFMGFTHGVKAPHIFDHFFIFLNFAR